jgi:hypothetical protein
MNAGSAIAARMPTIRRTTRISTSVKPRSSASLVRVAEVMSVVTADPPFA